MPILYDFKKEKDEFIIETEQSTVQTLFYLSSGDEVEIYSSTLLQNIPTIVTIKMDGKYKILLEVAGETSLEVFFYSFKELQNSLIEDAEEILCGEECINCNGKSKSKEDCTKVQNFFVKSLSFETLFIQSYGADFPLIFTNFLNDSVQATTCKTQTKVNTILAEELIKGRPEEKKVSSLSDLYIALYWAGMYFMEENMAGEDVEQIAFIKEKFHYNDVIECLCELCVDINTLKENYGKDMIYTEIQSFQFDGAEYDINNVALITPEWLDINGTVESEASLLSGKNIVYTNVGRIGFTITNNKDRYRFFDALGNDITDSVFDNVWDDTAKRQTYVSKEFYIPSVIYYNFVKI